MDNYRAITLSPTIAKVFESVLGGNYDYIIS